MEVQKGTYNTLIKLTEVCVHVYLYVLCRGQISRDYDQEFPSVEVGPRLVRRHSEDRQTTLHRQVSVDYVFQ